MRLRIRRMRDDDLKDGNDGTTVERAAIAMAATTSAQQG